MTRFFAGLGIGAFVVLLPVSLWFLQGSLAFNPEDELYNQILTQWVLFLIPEVILLLLLWQVWKALVGIQIELGKIRRGLGGPE